MAVSETKHSKDYFVGLNYSLGNEDTGLEFALQKKVKPQKIFSVCGSGARFIPFLAQKPKHISAIDLSAEQLLFSKFKMQTYKDFSYDEFLLFWGFPPYEWRENKEKRKIMLHELAIDKKIKNYVQTLFEQNEYQSILYSGKWEQTFRKLSMVVRRTLGKDFYKIFECKTLKEQKEFFHHEFPIKKFQGILLLLGNATLFNSLLYKGSFVKKNVPESYYQYYSTGFNNLFENIFLRSNFFIQICFFGHVVYPEGIPLDGQPDLFPLIKQNLLKEETEIELIKGDLIGTLQAKAMKKEQFDFISLSDVPSYFCGDLEKTFMQGIKKAMTPKGLAILRSYLKVPQVDLTGYQEITQKFSKDIEKEKLQMYRVQIFQNI